MRTRFYPRNGNAALGFFPPDAGEQSNTYPWRNGETEFHDLMPVGTPADFAGDGVPASGIGVPRREAVVPQLTPMAPQIGQVELGGAERDAGQVELGGAERDAGQVELGGAERDAGQAELGGAERDADQAELGGAERDADLVELGGAGDFDAGEFEVGGEDSTLELDGWIELGGEDTS